MEFLVEFEIEVPEGTPETEIADRERAEAAAAAQLADQGHVLRIWNRAATTGRTTVLGLYRADSRAELDGLIDQLPLREWMNVTVTPLEPHPERPGVRPTTPVRAAVEAATPGTSPDPGLPARRDPGRTARSGRHCHRAGAVSSPSPMEPSRARRSRAGWCPAAAPTGRSCSRTAPPWRTSVTHCKPLADPCSMSRVTGCVMAAPRCWLAWPGARTSMPASTRSGSRHGIETGDPDLDWLNKGVFVCVGGRQPGGVIYETYLVE